MRNKVVKGLNLISKPIKYTAPLNGVASSKQPQFTSNIFSVYPNPAKDILHVKTGGNVSISLLSQGGKILFTENISNAGSINIAGIAAGVYYVKNNSTNAVEEISIER